MKLSVNREQFSVDIDDGFHHIAEHAGSHELELVQCHLMCDYFHCADYRGIQCLGKK
jgi:hypothetical protein